MTAPRCASFPTAVRMVHRVHRNTANGGPHTSPSLRTGFAELAKVVLAMTYLADGGAAVNVNFSRLA